MMQRIVLLLSVFTLPLVASAEQTLEFERYDFRITLPDHWTIESQASEDTDAVGEVFHATAKRKKLMLNCEYAEIPASIVPSNERQTALLLQRWLPIVIESHENEFGAIEVGEQRFGVEAEIAFGEVTLVEKKKRRAKAAVYRIFPRGSHMIVCISYFPPKENPGHEAIFASIRPLLAP